MSLAGDARQPVNRANGTTGNCADKMGGGNCIYANDRARTYYSRRCKRKWIGTKTNVNSLPDDIVFDILVHLPVQDIHNATSLVCRKWYRMIHTHKFIHAHLQHSTHGLLIQNRFPKRTQLSFVALRKGQIEISKLGYEPGHEIWCSCNGLILESERQNHFVLYITNPATMQKFALPPFFGCSIAFVSSAIAYAALSMEYKVVRKYHNMDDYSKTKCLAILTVGVDNCWRHVDTQHLSPEATELFCYEPLTTEGFVHWARTGTYVVSLNVETEIITQIPVPQCHRGKKFGYYYFSTVGYLSLLISCSKYLWEVWEMKPETGEWTKLSDIDLEDAKSTIERLICKYDSSFKLIGFVCCTLDVVGWLKYKEVFVFNVRKVYAYHESNRAQQGFEQPRLCMAYNVCSKEIDLIELGSNSNRFLVHRNSLVWLDGC